MKNYKNYLLEHTDHTKLPKKETLGDRLKKAYDTDNEKLIEELIGFSKEDDFDYTIEFEKDLGYDNDYELSEIHLFCKNDEFDSYSDVESVYIGSYTEMRSYGFENIIERDEMNYQFNEENTKFLKEIYKMLDFKWKEDEYEDFFRLESKLIEDLTDELKWIVESGIESSKKEIVSEYWDKFYKDGFEVDGVNNKDYSLKITIVISELSDAKTFKEIFEKYFDDFNEFSELTYSTAMNDKEYKEKTKELNRALKKFIEDLKPYTDNDGIIDYSTFRSTFEKELIKVLDKRNSYHSNDEIKFLRDLGGKIFNEYIKSDKWQEEYIENNDKKVDNYNNLVNTKLITDNIKKKYAHLIAAKKFKI